MKKNVIAGLSLGLMFGVIGFSCSKTSTDNTSTSKKLYISTGLCYSGTGFTAPAADTVGQLVSRLDLESRQYEIVKDYADNSEEAVETYANGMVDGGDGYLYVAVENSNISSRRVDRIVKAENGAKTVWMQNVAYLGGTGAGQIVRGISRATDRGFLVGETDGIERFDSTPTRKESGPSTAWGAAFANTCANNNTRITDLIALPSAVTGDTIGKFIYAHADAGQNDIGIISKDGYTGLSSCIVNQASTAGALTVAASANSTYSATLDAIAAPTSMVYIPQGAGTGKLLVAYSSTDGVVAVNTAGSLRNALVMYDITENTTVGETASITNGTVLYNDHSYFFGVSAMAYDSENGHLYVASSNSLQTIPQGFNIEKFSVDLTTPSVTRLTNDDLSSFEESNSYNKCVTSMIVSD